MRWIKKVEIALLNLEMRSWLGWKSTEREWRSLDEFEDTKGQWGQIFIFAKNGWPKRAASP
jgi:hypothetical protein